MCYTDKLTCIPYTGTPNTSRVFDSPDRMKWMSPASSRTVRRMNLVSTPSGSGPCTSVIIGLSAQNQPSSSSKGSERQ